MSQHPIPEYLEQLCCTMVRNYAREAGAPLGVSVNEVLGRRRFKNMVIARKAVMRRLWEDGFSTPEIGFMLDRDHSTVLSGLGRLNK
jgi:chromosomal replication initiation ATPase DnaA